MPFKRILCCTFCSFRIVIVSPSEILTTFPETVFGASREQPQRMLTDTTRTRSARLLRVADITQAVFVHRVHQSIGNAEEAMRLGIEECATLAVPLQPFRIRYR